MRENGWLLNEILIWYKPNHMPSSVKNRFTNSFEPVFVFAKNENNYFEDYRRKYPDKKNILKINLQPTPYKHVAVFPEQLVEKLLNRVEVPDRCTVLDPFAGSGTTLKVINDANSSIFSKKYNGIMIEYNKSYVEIIKKRTGLQNIQVQKIPYLDYEYLQIKEEFTQRFETASTEKNLNKINIAVNQTDFYCFLKKLLSQNFINKFKKDKIIFLGTKHFDIEDIFNISLVNSKKWIIRNMIVVKNNNTWFPLFMLVHDNKKCKYIFNYKNLNLQHKTNPKNDFSKNQFLGYKVIDNNSKHEKIGKIIKIIDYQKNNFPKYVSVLWKNSEITKEFIIWSLENIQKNLIIKKGNSYPKIIEKKNIIKINNYTYQKDYYVINETSKSSEYKGKFKDLKRVNWGASPGARASLEEEYFSVQRLYDVDQNLVADYLNYIRKKNNLTKKAFIKLFPKNYKYTVGHWLRKDLGGSIPKPEDWLKINKKFNLDENYTNYVCKTALRLQTVKNAEYKLPEDFILNSQLKSLNLLLGK